MTNKTIVYNLENHQRALYKLLIEFDRICKKNNISYILFAGSMLGAVRHEGFIPWDDDLDVMMLRSEYERFLDVAKKEVDSNLFFVQQEFSEHWPMFFSKLRLNGTTCLEKYHPKDKQCHQGVYIDIFPCDNASNHAIIRKLQFYASKIIIAKSLYLRGYDTNSQVKKIIMSICRFLPTSQILKFVKHERKGDTKNVHCFLAAASSYQKSVFEREIITNQESVLFVAQKFPISKNYDRILTILYGDYMTLPNLEERKVKVHAFFVDLNNSWEKYVDYRDDIVFDEFTRSIR